MRIGIDISQIVYKGTGVGRFTEGLVEAICTNNKEHEWVFFFSGLRKKLNKDIEKKILEIGFTLVKRKVPPTFLSLMWNTLHTFPIESMTGKLDWFITSDWTEPPANCKKATVIHDLTVFRYPETVDSKILKTQKRRLKWVSKESSLVFADSETTKKDIRTYLPELKAPVQTIYPGVEVVRSTISNEQLEKKFGINNNFILSVGKLEPRKNLKSLLQAFEKAHLPKTELLIAGQHGWGAKIRPQKNVRMLGYVSDEELAGLYKKCLFFVYPSLWEGFGYPVVEAMKYSAAVATSKTSSLGEIAEGFGLTFDPTNIDDIAQCLRLLSSNKKTRDELKRKSLKRAQDFSWKSYYSAMEKALTNS